MIQRLRNHHHIIAMLAAVGKRPSEIAALCGMSANGISTMLGSPLLIAEIERIRNQLANNMLSAAVDRLYGEAENSIKTIVELRDKSKSDNTRLRAAMTLADRIPQLSQAQRYIDTNQPIMLTDEQVAFMTEALRDDPAARMAFEAYASVEGDSEAGPMTVFDDAETLHADDGPDTDGGGAV